MKTIKNNIGLSGNNILDILMYTLDINIDISDIFQDDLEINNLTLPNQAYAVLVFKLFEDLYNTDKLIKSYTNTKVKELDYIAGVIDVTKTVELDSLSRGKVAQHVSILSYNNEINTAISYCLKVGYKILNNLGIKIQNVYEIYNKIYDDKINKNFDKKKNDYIIEILEKYTEGAYSKAYINYYNLLIVCIHMLKSEKYKSKNANKHSEKSVYKKEIEYLMECFTRTTCRKVMKQISKDKKLKYNKNSNLLFYNSDKNFNSLRLDILIEFPKSESIPDIIIDVKTNKKLTDKEGGKYKHDKNIHQLSDYHNMYARKHKDNVACIFHYISSDSSDDARRFNNLTIHEQKSLRMYVYAIDSEEFTTENVELCIKNILQTLIEKGKEYVEYDDTSRIK
jgi:hypothetical protein